MARATKKTTKTIAEHEIKKMKVSDLKVWDQNPREISDEALAGLTKSVEEFGLVQPIVWNKQTDRVVGGHQRLQVLRKQGIEKTSVIVVDLSEEREKILNVTLNNPEIAGTFSDDIGDILKEIEVDDVNLFDELKLDSLLRELIEDNEEKKKVVEDDIPEPPKEPKTKAGDLWLLGEHRLLCGDSTKREDVERVMGGERAVLMNTDPPYGVGYDNSDRPNPGVAKPRVAKPRVANDSLEDEKLQEFLEASFGLAKDYALVDNAAWYMWHAHLTQGYFAAAAAAAAAVILHRQIIWVKPVLLLGRGQYHWRHESCFMGWVKGNQPPDYGLGGGERTQTTVWEIGSVTHAERKEFNHSTPKPVGLFVIPIVKHLKVGEIAYEPFAGSGPQFIAAEQLNRKCYGIEISPAYCDVIVERWEKFTGKKAKL